MTSHGISCSPWVLESIENCFEIALLACPLAIDRQERHRVIFCIYGVMYSASNLERPLFISLCYVGSIHTKFSTCSSLLHSCGLQGQARENKRHTSHQNFEANTIAPCFLRHCDLQDVMKNHTHRYNSYCPESRELFVEGYKYLPNFNVVKLRLSDTRAKTALSISSHFCCKYGVQRLTVQCVEMRHQ